MRKWIAAAFLFSAGAAHGLPLKLPPTASWKHAGSGLIVPPKLGPTARVSIEDRGSVEADVALRYASTDVGVEIDIFRALVSRVPIWFDRLRLSLGLAESATIAFKSTRDPVLDSLRLVNDGPAGPTAIAALRRDSWIVTIMARAPSLDAATKALDAAISGIRWPVSREPNESATAVVPCATAMAFGRARLIATNAGDILDDTTSGMIGLTREKQPNDEIRYCRDPTIVPGGTIYRGAEPDGYLIALGERGRIVNVTSSFAHDDDGKVIDRPRYIVSRLEPDYRALYRSFATTPPPEQALKELGRTPLSYFRETRSNSKGQMALPIR